jgi:serine-type D-Ala-D-Ala carboxypeptidase/endopeptidase (penicillin-binding protein 4)
MQVLVIHQTPLATVLAGANKFSTNLYAEALTKRLGAAMSNESGTWENGAAAIGEFLQSIGVPPEQFTLDDGSGLSKKNAVSANAITSVLARDFHGPNRDVFVQSLAVGGEDGTLDKRFQGDLRGRVFAKSGYVAGVFALSGYVRTRDNRYFAFSILMNNVHTNAAKDLQERIVKAIDQHG